MASTSDGKVKAQTESTTVTRSSDFHIPIKLLEVRSATPYFPNGLRASSACLSDRIERLRVRRSDFANEVEFDVESSKSHWTELSKDYESKESSSDVEDNEECISDVFERLKEHPEWGPFFRQHQWYDLEIGEKIGEGGQAEIFEASGTNWRDGIKRELVVKVFKEGYSLKDLPRLWPPGLATAIMPVRYFPIQYLPSLGKTMAYGLCLASDAQLVMGGRFAFVFQRYWGDLRKFIDMRMLQRNGISPFLYEYTLVILLAIAHGMDLLHELGLLHKDLKAANVLLVGQEITVEFYQHPTVVITDFESSVGIGGTGFWRAPEILSALKHCCLREETFTRETDVYSYAMTCYEVITGCLPFEKYSPYDYDIVLRGVRPTLPEDICPELKTLVSKCWHEDPLQRPSFEAIVGTLKELYSTRPWEDIDEALTLQDEAFLSLKSIHAPHFRSNLDFEIGRSKTHWTEPVMEESHHTTTGTKTSSIQTDEPPLMAIVSDEFEKNTDGAFLKVLQEEVTKLHYISKLLSTNNYSRILPQIEETIVLFHFNEDNMFEFYFNKYEDMARIIGVGLEYAKVILQDGWQMKVQEISKQSWEHAWKHLDSTSSTLKVTIPELSEACTEDVELSQKIPACIPRRSSLLLDIAKYFILTTTIASFLPKDTITNSNRSGGASSSSQSTPQDTTRSSTTNGNNIPGLIQIVKDLFFSEGGFNKLNTKDDSGVPADPPSNHGMKKATTVYLELLPGGCLSEEGRQGFDATPSNDEILKGLTSQLDNTITSEMKFTFINNDEDKEIQILVGPISFEFQKKNDNYEKTGRFGWFHNSLYVSFGAKNAECAKLSTYKALDVVKVKKTKTKGSTGQTTNGTTRKITGAAVGSVPAFFKLKVGGSSEWSTINSVCDNVGDTIEKDCDETGGGFSIIEKGYKTLATVCYIYLCLDHTTELNPVQLCDERHRKTLHDSAICIPQEVKFQGTWCTRDSGNVPQELVEYIFEASRVVQMTSKFEEAPRKKRSKSRQDDHHENRSVPLSCTQKRVKSVYLNHAMTHLNGGIFKVRERWTSNPGPLDHETYLTKVCSLNSPAWAGDDPLVDVNPKMVPDDGEP